MEPKSKDRQLNRGNLSWLLEQLADIKISLPQNHHATKIATPLSARLKMVQLFLAIMITSCFLAETTCSCQSTTKPSLPVGKWLQGRGPFDPRPYERTLLGSGLLNEKYFNMKNNLWIEKGISFGGYVSGNSQWGSEGGPAHNISESLLLFTWEAVRKSNSAGRLVIGFAHDQTFGHPTTRKFADTQRIVETPNDLDTDPELTFTTLGLLHWEHEWRTGPESGWGIRVGQIYAPSYFGPARYLDDDRRFFMARPLAAAAGAQWVGFNDIGLGFIGVAWKTPFYITVGVIDGMANRNYPDFKSLARGKMLYLGEIGLEHDVDGPNEAAIRLTISHLDADDLAGPGQSIMISGDMSFKGRWAIAGRWSQSFKRLKADYKNLVSLGFLWKDPFSRSQDLAGLGLFSGDPSESQSNWESGVELFYRLQLTHGISLLPDLQYWFRKNTGTSDTKTWVLGLRTEIEF